MVNIKQYNTFGIEAHAWDVVTYDSVASLQQFLRTNTAPLLLVGKGSNLLFLKDFEGILLHATLSDISCIDETLTNVIIKVGAGLTWDNFVAYAVSQGWYGLENLSLIPGDVGAAAVQNIGAYGAEAKDTITEVEAVDLQTGELKLFSQKDCHYAYRSSCFKHEFIGKYAITHVTFSLHKTFSPALDYGGLRQALAAKHIDANQLTAQQLRNLIIDIRTEKLPNPQVLGNAGSFFMNPIVEKQVYASIVKNYSSVPHYPIDENHVKIPAGWLIEQCGWKGKKLGKAGVYERQALVLVNHGGATGADILALCKAIQHDVHQKFNITIQPEVQFV